jgi:hypothetical protein
LGGNGSSTALLALNPVSGETFISDAVKQRLKQAGRILSL